MKNRADVIEWIEKAEQDYVTAETMARRRKNPVPEARLALKAMRKVRKYFREKLRL